MLVDFVLLQKPNLNFAMIKTLLRKKDIRINGDKVSQNKMLAKGDVVTLFLPQKNKPKVDVVFEDDKVLIVSKPSGMETTKKDKAYQQSDCLEDIFDGAFACHRLDKNTEGLVILAKSEKLANQMQEAIKLKKMHKYYQTIATGSVKMQGENLCDYLVKQDNVVKVFSKKVDDAKQILTNYDVLSKADDLFLLGIELLTGRTHQIRAHLAFHKIYVLGDQKYGDKVANKKYHAKRQLLCANKIVFDKMPYVFENLSNKTFEIAPTFSLTDFENKN